MSASADTPFTDFVGVLTEAADVVIEDVAPAGALSVTEVLAVRGWWDRERKRSLAQPPK